MFHTACLLPRVCFELDETIRFGLFRSNVGEPPANAKQKTVWGGKLKRIPRLPSQNEPIAAAHLRGFTKTGMRA
ncbi:hypothetical protein [Pandoraea terrigena]|uniref:hypothetical protein n=1 Tax=Pandoraea terrigena TaxID=2508292 RepID=UPI00123EF48F|nr:hypothetical protein [Pandoraea terrigena]